MSTSVTSTRSNFTVVHQLVVAGLMLAVSAALFSACDEPNRDSSGVVFQRGQNECAPAATTMMLNDLGKSVEYEDVLERYTLSSDGASVSQVVQVLRKFGVSASAWKLPRESLFVMRPPALLFLDGSHFVVLDSTHDGEVYVRDPSAGRKVLSEPDLRERWDGVTITIGSGEDQP